MLFGFVEYFYNSKQKYSNPQSKSQILVLNLTLREMNGLTAVKVLWSFSIGI